MAVKDGCGWSVNISRDECREMFLEESRDDIEFACVEKSVEVL